MIKININAEFTVTLTEKGKEIYIKYLEQFDNNKGFWGENYYYKEKCRLECEDKLKMELWNLMNIFGLHLYNGCEIPFKDNIIEIS